MNAIVAADKNWAIGYKNKLLVSIPADMKFFRQMTGGKVVVMGRKTLESFPNGLPLKNRTNIVLTGNPNYHVKDAVIVHTTRRIAGRTRKNMMRKEILCDRAGKCLPYDASLLQQSICNKDRPCISGRYVFPESGSAGRLGNDRSQ